MERKGAGRFTHQQSGLAAGGWASDDGELALGERDSDIRQLEAALGLRFFSGGDTSSIHRGGGLVLPARTRALALWTIRAASIRATTCVHGLRRGVFVLVLRLLDLIPLECAVLDPEGARYFIEAGRCFALECRDLLVDLLFIEICRDTVDGDTGLDVGELYSHQVKARARE